MSSCIFFLKVLMGLCFRFKFEIHFWVILWPWCEVVVDGLLLLLLFWFWLLLFCSYNTMRGGARSWGEGERFSLHFMSVLSLSKINQVRARVGPLLCSIDPHVCFSPLMSHQRGYYSYVVSAKVVLPHAFVFLNCLNYFRSRAAPVTARTNLSTSTKSYLRFFF